jgi:hypothetical protein
MGARMSTINNTMRILSSALILFSFNTLPFVTSSIAIANNTPNPYSIGGVRIQMTEKQVLNLLGKPTNRTTGKLDCSRNRFVQLNYSQGKIVFEEDTRKNNYYAITVETKIRRWGTEKSIKVGDNISKAKKLYIFTDTKSHGGEWQVKGKTNRPGILRFKTNGQQEIITIDLVSSYDC